MILFHYAVTNVLFCWYFVYWSIFFAHVFIDLIFLFKTSRLNYVNILLLLYIQNVKVHNSLFPFAYPNTGSEKLKKSHILRTNHEENKWFFYIILNFVLWELQFLNYIRYINVYAQIAQHIKHRYIELYEHKPLTIQTKITESYKFFYDWMYFIYRNTYWMW